MERQFCTILCLWFSASKYTHTHKNFSVTYFQIKLDLRIGWSIFWELNIWNSVMHVLENTCITYTVLWRKLHRDEKLSQKLKTTQPDDIDLHFQVNTMLFDGITFGSCLTYLLLLLFPAVSEPLLFFPFAWQANNREISQTLYIIYIHFYNFIAN